MSTRKIVNPRGGKRPIRVHNAAGERMFRCDEKSLKSALELFYKTTLKPMEYRMVGIVGNVMTVENNGKHLSFTAREDTK